jgi:aromatase
MAGHTENEVVIDAPFDLVWDMTNDVANWPSLFTEYASAEILEDAPEKVVFRLSTHPDENGQVWSWVSERLPDKATGTVVARRVETGPFEYMNIAWTYTDEGGSTRMRWVQDFHMKDAAPVNDEQMTERINTNTPIQMAAIKDKVEKAAANS